MLHWSVSRSSTRSGYLCVSPSWGASVVSPTVSSMSSFDMCNSLEDGTACRRTGHSGSSGSMSVA